MEKQHTGMIGRAFKTNGLLLIPLCVLLLLVVCFEIIPALYILITAFRSDSGFTVENFVKPFIDQYYLKSLKNSVLLSLFSAFVGVAIGTITALCIRNGVSESVGNKLLTITNMTTNYAGVPLAFAFIILLGTNGLVTLFAKNVLHFDIYAHGFDLYSWSGITAIYIYFQIPLAIMLMYPAVGVIKQQLKDASKVLGASTPVFWLKIGIPMLIPSIIGSFCILFANALGAYATAYALVTANLGIMAVCIGNLVSGDINPNPYLACALASIMGGILMILLFVKNKMYRKVN